MVKKDYSLRPEGGIATNLFGQLADYRQKRDPRTGTACGLSWTPRKAMAPGLTRQIRATEHPRHPRPREFLASHAQHG